VEQTGCERQSTAPHLTIIWK